MNIYGFNSQKAGGLDAEGIISEEQKLQNL